MAATTKTLTAEPSLDTLQSLQQDWQRRELETKGWLSQLTAQATKLQEALTQLGDLQKTWSSTRAAAQETKAPDPILQQIDATLTAITAAQGQIQSERTALLNLQSRVALEVTKCGTALTQIGQVQQKAVAGILLPDVPPIWQPESWADALTALPEHVRSIAAADWSDIVTYAREPRDGRGAWRALHHPSPGIRRGAAQGRCLGEVRRGSIVGDLGLRATLRSGFGHDFVHLDFAFLSDAHRVAAVADSRSAGADAPPGAANGQCFGRNRASMRSVFCSPSIPCVRPLGAST